MKRTDQSPNWTIVLVVIALLTLSPLSPGETPGSQSDWLTLLITWLTHRI